MKERITNMRKINNDKNVGMLTWINLILAVVFYLLMYIPELEDLIGYAPIVFLCNALSLVILTTINVVKEPSGKGETGDEEKEEEGVSEDNPKDRPEEESKGKKGWKGLFSWVGRKKSKDTHASGKTQGGKPEEEQKRTTLIIPEEDVREELKEAETHEPVESPTTEVENHDVKRAEPSPTETTVIETDPRRAETDN